MEIENKMQMHFSEVLIQNKSPTDNIKKEVLDGGKSSIFRKE